jgi:GNAT superfamily N-acetyltransferase
VLGASGIEGDDSSSPVEVARSLLYRPGAVAFCGTFDGVVAGVAVVRPGRLLAARDAAGRGVATLVFLFVEEGFRELGVGEALLEAIASWRGDSGVEVLEVAVPPGARAAKALFERLGFSTRLLILESRR